MLKLFTEPTDEFLKLLKKNSQPISPAIYEYQEFHWRGERLYYGSKPFTPFSPSDIVLFRQDRGYSEPLAFWIRTLAALAAAAGANVINFKVWQSFPHFSDKYVQALLFASASIAHVPTWLLSQFPLRRQSFPVICKPRLSCMGKGTKIITTLPQLSSFTAAVDPQTRIVQPFYPLQRDIRVLVVTGKIFGAVERTVKLYPDGRIGVKVARAAVLTPTEKRLTHSCILGLGIDLMGVDLLTDLKGRSWVAEINLAPNVTGFSRVTGVDAAVEMINLLQSRYAGTDFRNHSLLSASARGRRHPPAPVGKIID